MFTFHFPLFMSNELLNYTDQAGIILTRTASADCRCWLVDMAIGAFVVTNAPIATSNSRFCANFVEESLWNRGLSEWEFP